MNSIVWDNSQRDPGHCNKASIETRNGTKVLTYWHGSDEVAQFEFPATGIQFASPLVRYDNLLFRGGWGSTPVKDGNDDIFQAVFEGRKAVGQSWSVTREETSMWIGRVEQQNQISGSRFGYHVIRPFQDKPRIHFVSIYRNGSVGEVFGAANLAVLDEDYARAGLPLDNDDLTFRLSSYVDTPIADLVQQNLETHPLHLIGLLYGYPVESTMSILLPSSTDDADDDEDSWEDISDDEMNEGDFSDEEDDQQEISKLTSD